ncbi:MAG TPA: dihydrofolate reductase, partial [Candidatus Avipropionibacterium avicola]|nr:dihydrofolate reductase [Candidatus Avipropionibacterium avicola]
MLAWLPYADEDELVSRIGPLPDGVEFEPVDRHQPNGPSIDRVEFFVLPYLTGANSLDRIAEMSSLQVVQTQTAGFENVIDLIPDPVTLCNGAGIHDTATAEMALALALANARHVDVYARNQTSGTWKPHWGSSLADQRITILGYGRIGKAIEARVAGFEPASITKVASRARDDIHGIDELAELLPRTDVLFVIAPLTPQTEGLLDAAALALLPDNALVVNVARGKIIDTDALVAETTSGRLRAALDVTDPEPLPQDHPLWTIPGVTISPHVGGASSAFHPRTDALIKAQLHRWAT